MSRRMACLLGLVAALGPGVTKPLRAEPVPSAAVSTPPMDPSKLIDLSALEEEAAISRSSLTVSAVSRYEQRASEAPANVNVIPRERILRFGWRTLAEALRSLPGFYMTDDRTYSFIGLRGILRPADYGGRILVQLDGHRVNDNVYDQNFPGQEFPVDLDLIDHIEVVRGPSSSLYGTNAVLAVVNIITRRGRDLEGAEASTSLGSFDTYNRRLSYGTTTRGGVDVLASASRYDSAGRDFYFPEFDDPATNDGLSVGCDAEEHTSAFLKTSWRDFTLEFAQSRRQKNPPGAQYGMLFDRADVGYRDDWGSLDLGYDHRAPEGTSVLARVSANWYDFNGLYPYDSGTPGLTLWNNDLASGRWWGVEAQASRQVQRRHRLVVGAELRRNTRQDQRNLDLSPYTLYLDAPGRSDLFGFYGQDEWRLRRNLLLYTGFRYDRWDFIDARLSPRLAVVHTPRPGTTWKLLFGEAFRAPNAYERHYASATWAANPALGAEKTRTYELAFERTVARNTSLVASVYQLELSDMVTQAITAGGLDTFVNQSAAEVRGLEVELASRRPEGRERTIGVALQRAEDDTTGGRLSNSPTVVARAGVVEPVLGPRIFAGLELLIVGGRLTRDGTDELGGYALANLTLTRRDARKRFEVSASVYNILDRRFAYPIEAIYTPNAIAGEGRAAQLKVTMRF